MNPLNLPIKGVLFDLDGTLLDTANDLGMALNQVLKAHQLTPLDPTVIRPFAGRGCKGLLKLGMNVDNLHPEYANLCTELLRYYEKHCLDTTTLFPGMESILLHLEQANIPWGIVTNKPHKYTLPLLSHLQLQQRAACIVSGDSLDFCKPHPAPILHACDLLRINPQECLYIGDSEVDVIASKAAGTFALVAMYGYFMPDDKPMSWQADGYINHPSEILTWI